MNETEISETTDLFYCDANLRYLNEKKEELIKGVLKTAEHSLIED